METEYSFLKAPYEGLNRTFRNSQKAIEKDLSQTIAQFSELDKKKDKLSREDAIKSIDRLVVKLQGLKRKVVTSSALEQYLLMYEIRWKKAPERKRNTFKNASKE